MTNGFWKDPKFILAIVTALFVSGVSWGVVISRQDEAARSIAVLSSQVTDVKHVLETLDGKYVTRERVIELQQAADAEHARIWMKVGEVQAEVRNERKR